jgi:zinc transporter
MSATSISLICAFDVVDGDPRALNDPWPDVTPADGASYRWMHFDLAEPQMRCWADTHLPPIAAEALLQSETRPRCDPLGDGLILNLRGVNMNPGASPEDMVSLRLWVTGQCIVTARVRKVWAADDLRLNAESGQIPASVGLFLAELVSGLARRIETVSLELEETTDDFEDDETADVEARLKDLKDLRQTVTKMRRFVRPQRDALENLTESGIGFLDQPSLRQMRESANRNQRALEELESTRDRLSIIMDHIHARQSDLRTRNSYLLSVIAAVFLPLGFLTGLFGVNVAGMPGVDHPMAFGLLALASVLIGIALFVLFRLLRWL